MPGAILAIVGAYIQTEQVRFGGGVCVYVYVYVCMCPCPGSLTIAVLVVLT